MRLFLSFLFAYFLDIVIMFGLYWIYYIYLWNVAVQRKKKGHKYLIRRSR